MLTPETLARYALRLASLRALQSDAQREARPVLCVLHAAFTEPRSSTCRSHFVCIDVFCCKTDSTSEMPVTACPPHATPLSSFWPRHPLPGSELLEATPPGCYRRGMRLLRPHVA